jgi:hypothetical protein
MNDACRGNQSPAASLPDSMDNIQYEITHERLILLIANQLDVPADHIILVPITGEETSAVRAVVRVSLATANKIERRIKKLEAPEKPTETPKAEK